MPTLAAWEVVITVLMSVPGVTPIIVFSALDMDVEIKKDQLAQLASLKGELALTEAVMAAVAMAVTDNNIPFPIHL